MTYWLRPFILRAMYKKIPVKPRTSLIVILAVLFCNSAFAKIYIDISSPYVEKIPIAVTPAELSMHTYENRMAARKLTTCLSSDLIFHGFFSVFDSVESGQGHKVDYLVKTRFEAQGGSVNAVLKLIDLSSNSMLTGRRYLGGINDLRKMAHRFSNEIVKAITGMPGVSLSKICFVSKTDRGREIFSADFDGMNIRQETYQRTIVMSPRYSPDGRYLAFTSFRTGSPCLYIKILKTGKIYRLADYQGLNMSPGWAPSGQRLAVTLSKAANPDLYLIDLKGRILKRLTRVPGIDVSPSFSPDGKRLVFVSDRSGTPQLFILEIATGSIKRLTFTGNYNTDPQWSPTDHRIVYVSRVGGQFQIFTIPPEGGDPVQLTYEGSNENPSWSPDGRQIVFSSTRVNGRKAIFVMLANGQDQRLLIDYGMSDYFPFWGPNAFK